MRKRWNDTHESIDQKTAALRGAVIITLVILAGCGGEPQATGELPTVVSLPSLTVTATPSPVTPSATPTNTLTATITASVTATVTPSATITDTPTATPTATPTVTNTPEPTADNEGIVALALTAAQATVLPTPILAAVPTLPVSGVTAAPSCTYGPPGGFATVYTSDPTLAAQLGCPTATSVLTMNSAAQVFERGFMMWLEVSPAGIYALYNTGRFGRYDDTFNASVDPISGGEVPPAGLKEPVRGFGKVWRTFPEVRSGLGWAVNDESGGTATVQAFERGVMIYLPQRGEIVVLVYDPGTISGGTWRSVVGSY